MTKNLIRALLGLPEVSDAQISPNASLLAFMVRTTNWQTARHERHLVIRPIIPGGASLGPELGRITGHTPRWAPTQETLAFIGTQADGKPSLNLWSNGESNLCCTLPPGSHGLRWSPIGDVLAFLAPIPPQGEDEDRPWTRLDEPTTPIELWTANPASGEVQMASGLGGHIISFSWHPDQPLLFCSVTPGTSSRHWDQGRLVLLDLDEPQNPLELGLCRCLNGVWSPDGSRIAVEQLQEPTFLTNPNLVIADPTGQITRIHELPDEFRILQWTHEGLLCLLIRGTSSTLVWVDPDLGTLKPCLSDAPDGFTLIEGWFGAGCALTADARKLSAICHDAQSPGEAALVNLEDGSLQYVTDARSEYREWGIPEPRTVRWTAEEGREIEGVLVTPADVTTGPHPLLVILHGGPTAMASQAPLADNDWIWGLVPEVVRRGAYVLLPNYQGSIGYGASFRAANALVLGKRNVGDIVSGIEHLSHQFEIDATRIAALGASHGGYLAAYLAARTRRFAAAVVRSGICDWTLNSQLNLNPDWEHQYFAGDARGMAEAYRAASVLPYVDKHTAPMLILHGDRDRQAPTANAYALHRALSQANVPHETILYHGMGHGGASLMQTEHSLEQTLQWLERWIRLMPVAAPSERDIGSKDSASTRTLST